MRLCSWKDRKTIVAGLRRVYTAVNAEAAAEALDELEEQWGNRYPGVIRIWRQAWEEFTPFLKVPARASQGRVHHACLNGGCGSAGGDDSCTPCPTCFGVVALLVSVSPPVARSVLSLDRSVTCICPPWGGYVVSTHGCASPSLLPLPQIPPKYRRMNHVRYRHATRTRIPFRPVWWTTWARPWNVGAFLTPQPATASL